MKDFNRALPYIVRATEAQPDNNGLKGNLAALYMELRRFDDAGRTFEAMLRTDPGNIDVRFNLGRIRFQEGKANAAFRHFQRVAGKGEKFVMAYYYLAVLSEKGNQPGEARAYAQEFLKSYRGNDQFSKKAEQLAARR